LLAATVRDFSISHPDFDFGGIQGDASVLGMVQETLGPNRKPVRTADTSRFFNQFDDWFNTKAGVNAETCVDIPMNKSDDGRWMYDSYATPAHGFWPIDDFTIDNRTPNPHNEQAKASCYVRPETDQWVTSAERHNMNFCMESHATFVYQPGQKFEFRGDDDVWVYINNKLVLDLGGIHIPKADTIDLDLLGLEAGKTYNWDFFYCDRQPCGSSLRIKTSIYFKQQRALEAVTQTGTPGTFFIKKYTGGAGACGSNGEAVTEVPITSLIYELWNVTGTEKKTLIEGSNLDGGIVITTPKVVIDTAKILDLPPGNYRVVAFEDASPSVRAEIPFRVASGVTALRPSGIRKSSFPEPRKPGRDALGRAKKKSRGPLFLENPK
jgi:fibro-slime domain-containing protein